jgi:hypothetical protein
VTSIISPSSRRSGHLRPSVLSLFTPPPLIGTLCLWCSSPCSSSELATSTSTTYLSFAPLPPSLTTLRTSWYVSTWSCPCLVFTYPLLGLPHLRSRSWYWRHRLCHCRIDYRMSQRYRICSSNSSLRILDFLCLHSFLFLPQVLIAIWDFFVCLICCDCCRGRDFQSRRSRRSTPSTTY